MKNQTLLKPSIVTLDGILSIDLGKVEQRLTNTYLWSSALATLAVNEYKKFIALQVLTKEYQPMCSEIVDFVWHNHILFTKDYTDFCVSVFGYYLHHEPNVNEEVVQISNFVSFTKNYETYFGELPKIWFAKNNVEPYQPAGQLCQPKVMNIICVPTGINTICEPTGGEQGSHSS